MVEPWLTSLGETFFLYCEQKSQLSWSFPFASGLVYFYTLLNTKGESYSGPVFSDVLYPLFSASLDPSSAIFEPFSYYDPQI